MIKQCHTRLGSVARSRRGFICEEGTRDMELEMEPYYDFTGSAVEVMDQLNDQKRVASILRYFDFDFDGRLKREELEYFYEAVSGSTEFPEEQYVDLCEGLGVVCEDG